MNDAASLSDDLDYRLLFESSPDLYLILNDKLVIVAASNAYTEATLTSREEILGKTMFEVFPDNPNDPTAEGQKNLRASQQRVLLSGKPDTMPVQKYDIPRPDGNGFEERYWSPMHIPILGSDGHVAYIIHRAEDLTEFIRVKQQGIEQSQLNETLRAQAVKMEVELFARSKEIASASAELKDANEELSRLYAKVLELDELKTQFFANVSHEFRTPLTLMIGPLEELLARFASQGMNPGEVEYEQLSLVHRNSLRLLKLVNSLLDFSRIEAGRMTAIYEATDLAKFTTELVSTFVSATDKAGLKLIVSCPALPQPVYVDWLMWEKIVLNLVSNAFKHTFKGEIEIALRDCGDWIELTVRDTGVGIAEDQLEHVFDRFHRVANVRSRSHEGTGIGLALVRELARLHGGEVTVKSTPNIGSTFTVKILTGTAHLPAEQIHSSHMKSPYSISADFCADEVSRWTVGMEHDTGKLFETAPSTATSASLDGHILLADDNADMRRYVARLLEEQGYAVTTVADGEEALAAVREHAPDIVLTDIMMPRLDGIGLLKALREDPDTAALPIILLSARAGEEERLDGLKHKPDDYLVKPFSARELLAHVGARLQISRLRKEIQAQLVVQEVDREFRSLAETMPQIVWTTRPDGWAVYFNHQWAEYTGLTLEESCGDNWNIPFHPEDKQRAWDAWQRATQHNERYALECRLRRHDGVYRWWLIRGVPFFNEQGEIQKWYGTCTDIQELKEANIAIQQLNETLEGKVMERTEALIQAKQAADEANRAKSFFLANMSHEIRTPMNAIIGLSSLLLMTEMTTSQRDYLERIVKASKSLLGLINDILDFSKIEAGQLDIDNSSFRLSDAVHGVINLFEFAAKDKGLSLSFDIDPALPVFVLGDALRIEQILINLLGNAIKFTAQGGVQLTLKSLSQPDEHTVRVRFAIHDTGIGIPHAYQAQLFSPFTQAHTSIARRYGGSGLGLSIVKRLVELMQGDIGVDSVEGQCTTINLDLPLGIDAVGLSSVQPMLLQTLGEFKSLAEDAKPIRGAQVLVVEDNPDNQLVIQGVLDAMQLTVTMAHNGFEALQRCGDQAFDVVLMDLNLPDIDGFEVTARLRECEQTQRLPVIALTASASHDIKRHCLAAGMIAHLCKPFEPRDLLTLLLDCVPHRTSIEDQDHELTEDTPAPAIFTPVDSAKLFTLLDQLEPFLQRNFSQAIQVVEAIETVLLNSSSFDDFKPVASYVRHLDYKKALAALKDFNHRLHKLEP